MSLATATWGCRLSTSPPQCAPIIQNDGDEDTPRASYREHYRQPRSLCVCRLPLHDMASDAAPREGESRLHELLEKTIQAVTKLNDSIVGLSESQSHAGHRRSIQAEQPNHDRPPASSNRESPDRVSRGTSRRTMTSSGIPPPASSDPNGMLEMGPSKADLTSQNAAGAATMPIIVLDSSSEGSTLGSEYDHSDTEDTLLELITFTSEVGITRITGVDLKDNVKVTLDLDQVPEVVRRLALQVVPKARVYDRLVWVDALSGIPLHSNQQLVRHAAIQGMSVWGLTKTTRDYMPDRGWRKRSYIATEVRIDQASNVRLAEVRVTK
ncbi:hypothetical protein KC323_g138 [Hortaea werneckii]|nr:hypothetical protein KC323_g138 [Hortaea werneckii]